MITEFGFSLGFAGCVCLFCLGSFFLLSRLASYIQCSMSLVPSSSRAGLGSSADDIFVTSISILGCGEGVSEIRFLGFVSVCGLASDLSGEARPPSSLERVEQDGGRDGRVQGSPMLKPQP